MDTNLPLTRWHAVAYYRTVNGSLDVHYDLELHDRIERGPNWNTVERIEVFRADPNMVALTVERSEEL